MSKITALPLLWLAVLLALAPGEIAAQGYDLPPAPSPSPTASPAYGPQDPERPVARPIPVPTQSAAPVPRDTPTPQPTADARPSPVPSRQVTQPRSTALHSPRPTAGAPPLRRPIPQAQATGAPAASVSAPQPSEPESDPIALPAAPPQQDEAPSAAELREEESRLPWLWIALGALAAMLAGAFAWWRRRDRSSVAASVPQIERPVPVKRTPNTAPPIASAPAAIVADPAKVAPVAAAPKPAAVAFDSGPLHVAFEARNITATMMAVTLAYRITLSNRGDAPLTGILVGGTMDAATDNLAIERQLEPPAGQLPVAHQLERLAAGEVAELTGEIRVPFSQLRPIKRGDQILLVPIARMRAAASQTDQKPLIAQQSVLLGIAGQGPQLGAIRLDQGPRVYASIGQRLVAPQAA